MIRILVNEKKNEWIRTEASNIKYWRRESGNKNFDGGTKTGKKIEAKQRKIDDVKNCDGKHAEKVFEQISLGR